MSPWRMMNEWGIPTFYLQSLAQDYLSRLAAAGEYVPAVAIAGGFSMEDHLYKVFAMGAPFVKLVGMARAPLTATMVGRNTGLLLDEGGLPKHILKHGKDRERVFVDYDLLIEKYGDRGPLPDGAVGLYGYMSRSGAGAASADGRFAQVRVGAPAAVRHRLPDPRSGKDLRDLLRHGRGCRRGGRHPGRRPLGEPKARYPRGSDGGERPSGRPPLRWSPPAGGDRRPAGPRQTVSTVTRARAVEIRTSSFAAA